MEQSITVIETLEKNSLQYGIQLKRVYCNLIKEIFNRCSGMDGGWGMKSEFFDESMKVAERCVNDMSQKESDVACSDCSLASHQLNQASNGEVMPSHPVLELHKAYGLNND